MKWAEQGPKPSSLKSRQRLNPNLKTSLENTRLQKLLLLFKTVQMFYLHRISEYRPPLNCKWILCCRYFFFSHACSGDHTYLSVVHVSSCCNNTDQGHNATAASTLHTETEAENRSIRERGLCQSRHRRVRYGRTQVTVVTWHHDKPLEQHNNGTAWTAEMKFRIHVILPRILSWAKSTWAVES